MAAFLPALLLALVTRTLVAEAALIDGPSMQPNLRSGYAILAEKVSYQVHTPRRGDVLLFALPGEAQPLIKRVVGLPGEEVAVRGGHTYINGKQLDEPWVTYFGGADLAQTRVPDDSVLLLGDNRSNSRDSRYFGPVPRSAIRGHVVLVFWPLDQIQSLP